MSDEPSLRESLKLRLISMLVPAAEELTPAEYFRRNATVGPELKPLGRPCHDCAVVCGMYAPFSDDLARQPPKIVAAYSARWFCHNHTDRACRGNIDRIAALQGDSKDGSSPKNRAA